ncbi:hypothetical protein SDC9_180556 [bioreactor metagenome]|uniref:Uncharacterized protein n=1 Tax=bioreactor metagenome TaxID=1076179 RepID=A0A645HBA6_9ZZZZ
MGGHDLGEARILRQEAVAWVNRLSARDLRRSDDRGNVQVALGRSRRPDADAFVGQPHPHGAGVALRVDRHGRDTHLLAGPMDSQGDPAAIGDEDFAEHAFLRRLNRPRALRAQGNLTASLRPGGTGHRDRR